MKGASNRRRKSSPSALSVRASARDDRPATKAELSVALRAISARGLELMGQNKRLREALGFASEALADPANEFLAVHAQTLVDAALAETGDNK